MHCRHIHCDKSATSAEFCALHVEAVDITADLIVDASAVGFTDVALKVAEAAARQALRSHDDAWEERLLGLASEPCSTRSGRVAFTILSALEQEGLLVPEHTVTSTVWVVMNESGEVAQPMDERDLRRWVAEGGLRAGEYLTTRRVIETRVPELPGSVPTETDDALADAFAS